MVTCSNMQIKFQISHDQLHDLVGSKMCMCEPILVCWGYLVIHRQHMYIVFPPFHISLRVWKLRYNVVHWACILKTSQLLNFAKSQICNHRSHILNISLSDTDFITNTRCDSTGLRVNIFNRPVLITLLCVYRLWWCSCMLGIHQLHAG